MARNRQLGRVVALVPRHRPPDFVGTGVVDIAHVPLDDAELVREVAVERRARDTGAFADGRDRDLVEELAFHEMLERLGDGDLRVHVGEEGDAVGFLYASWGRAHCISSWLLARWIAHL